MNSSPASKTLLPLPTIMSTIRGKIKFAGKKAPQYLPNGSTLTVLFQDTSMMDVAAIPLGKYVLKIQQYHHGQDLCFEIKAKCLAPGSETSLSAVLNVGWAPSGDEWIRKGDYFNDTRHPVRLVPGKDLYEGCDIEVKKYT